MKTSVPISLSFLLVLALNSVHAQTAEASIAQAQQKFVEGHYWQALELIPANLSGSDLVSAHQLRARIFQELGYSDSAFFYLRKIVHKHPLYQPPDDVVQPDLILLFKKIDVRPRLSLFVAGGRNYTDIRITSDNRPFTGEGYNETTSGGWNSHWTFLGLRYHVSRRLSIQTSFDRDRYRYIKRARFSGEHETVFSEDLKYLSFPLIGRFTFWQIRERFHINLNLGIKNSFLTDAEATMVIRPLTELEEGVLYNRPQTLNAINTRAYRQNSFLSALGGVDLDYRFQRFTAGIGMFYEHGVGKITREGFSRSNEDLTFFFYHQDNEFSLNNVSINLQVSYVIYYRIRPKNVKP